MTIERLLAFAALFAAEDVAGGVAGTTIEGGDNAGGEGTNVSGGSGEGAEGAASGSTGGSEGESEGINAGAGQDSAEAGGERQWFPDDWRDQITSGLSTDAEKERAKAFLKTRQSPYDVVRSAISADSKISELARDRFRVPDEKADPKDVAAYRKARGVPEEGKYAFELDPEVGQLSELDEEVRDEFLSGANELHWGQKDVDFAKETFVTFRKMQAAQQIHQAKQAGERARNELRAEMGRDFAKNVELANRYLEENLGRHGAEDAADRNDFLSKRFADGTALGEYPPFVRLVTELAREASDHGALELGDSAGTNVDQRIDEIMELSHTKPKEYEALQPELQRLIQVQQRKRG